MEAAIRKLECQTAANKASKKRADELGETIKHLKAELAVVTQSRDQMGKRITTLERDITKLRVERVEKIKEKTEALGTQVNFLLFYV
jgi:uncharacterized protein YoxC